MGRRTVLLIAAILVAALGTTAVFMYASRAEDAAFAAQSPVQVLVATAGIASGTSGSAISKEGSVELKQLPAASVPAGALSDLTPVAELVTTTSVFPGQVILKQMFGSEQQVSGGLTLPKGTMGVSVELKDPARVAGFVRPGSEVAVFLTVTTGSGEATTTQTGVMLERVPVVAVGPSTVSTSTTTADGTTNSEEIPTAILTLALSQQEAQKVIQGSASGSLYFGLLNKESAVDDAATNTTSTDLLK